MTWAFTWAPTCKSSCRQFSSKSPQSRFPITQFPATFAGHPFPATFRRDAPARDARSSARTRTFRLTSARSSYSLGTTFDAAVLEGRLRLRLESDVSAFDVLLNLLFGLESLTGVFT